MYPNFILWTLSVSLLQMPSEPLPVTPPPAGEGPGEAPMQMPMQMPPSHPPFGGEAPGGPRPVVDIPDVISRLDQTEGLREAPKTFEIALSIASEYAQADRVEEAAFYFGQAFEKAAPLRALFLKLGEAEAEVACEEIDADKALALEFAKVEAQKPQAKQAACLRLLMPKVLETGKQLATFQVLSKDFEGAQKTWESLLALDNTSLEASYALGALLLEAEGDKPASLERAQKLLQNVAQAKHPRASAAKAILTRVEAALEAGGNAKVRRSRAQAFKPSALSAALPEASPPTQAQALDEAERLLVAKQYPQALNRYLKQVDSNQRSARVNAGMAFALARLGTQGEMAERVWQAAEENPEALDALAQVLKAGGDAEGARWIWERLLAHPRFGAIAKERLGVVSE